MGCLNDDLDRFLKTDGIRIVREAGGVRRAPARRLTERDIERFSAAKPERMSLRALKDLREQAEDLRDEIEEGEPKDKGGEAHARWDRRLSAAEDFLDEIRDRLNGCQPFSSGV